jgi:hypothetical protein
VKFLTPKWRNIMDKKINKIKKEAKHEVKELGALAKADKKRDKYCEAGKKAMHKKK